MTMANSRSKAALWRCVGRPATNFIADYTSEKGDQDSTPAYYQNKDLVGLYPGYNLSRSRTYRAIDLEDSKTHFEGHTLTLSWDVSDALTIKSLTGYRELCRRSFFPGLRGSFLPSPSPATT